MPEPQKIIRSSSFASPNVLVVNEVGPVGSHLADSLLALGCHLYYFGNKKKDKIDHLLGKSNFELIDNLDSIYELSSLTYVFYLSDLRCKYLAEIAKKVKDKNAKLLFAFQGNQDLARKLLEELKSLGIDARACIFGEIYGPRLEGGIFSSILKNAVSGQNLIIPWDETAPVPLVFCSDFVSGLTRAIFTPDTSGKIFFLGQPTSCLTFLSQVEKKVSNLPKIDFVKKQGRNYLWEEFKETSPDFAWFPQTSLSEGIAQTIAWYKQIKQPSGPKEKRSPVFFKTPSSIKKKIAFGLSTFLFLIFIFFFFPLLAFWVSFSFSKKNFEKAQINWEKGDLPAAKQSLKLAKDNLVRSKRIFELSLPFYSLVGLETGLGRLQPFLDGGEKFLESTSSFLQALDIFSSGFSSAIKGQKTDISTGLNEAKELLEKSYLDVSLAWGILEGSWEEKPVAKLLKVESYLDLGKIFLPKLKTEIVRLKMICLNLPELIGKNGRRVYLVILQNNLQLRPTGGFIGSYGILTFDDGKLIDFDFQDVSSADSLFKGQVEPPPVIKNFLGEKNWYLKDANWDPDFTSSGRKIAWFFEKETGRQVDGVIAVNLYSAKRILEILGGVEIEAFSGAINAANIFEKAAYYSSSGFPGAQGKIDFFGEIAKAIMEKMRADDFNNLKFLETLRTLLIKKEIFFYSNSEPILKLVNALNWDGSIPKESFCQNISGGCFEDFVFPVEANLGPNRANFFVRRMINHSVSLSEEGNLSETLKINWQNLSLSDAWPAGRYKNYLRILLPSGTNLESVMLNDPADPNFWIQIPQDKIEVATISGKLSFGFLLEIPAGSSRIVEVKYLSPFRIGPPGKTSYFLFVQKQSGIEETPYSLEFSFPSKFQPLKILPKGTFSSGKVVINEILDEDKIFRIDFKD